MPLFIKSRMNCKKYIESNIEIVLEQRLESYARKSRRIRKKYSFMLLFVIAESDQTHHSERICRVAYMICNEGCY